MGPKIDVIYEQRPVKVTSCSKDVVPYTLSFNCLIDGVAWKRKGETLAFELRQGRFQPPFPCTEFPLAFAVVYTFDSI